MDLERLSHLLASSDPETRSQAAKQAGESGDAASVKPLAARLKVEPEAKVRGALLASIARFTTPESINAIRAQAADPDPKNRCRVLESLYRAQDQTVFPLAVRMLSDLDAEVKSMAFQIVRRLGKDGVMQIIQKMLGSDDVRWKVYAVAALGQVASTEGVAVLAKCMSQGSAEVRMQARASLVNLAKHGNDAAAKALAAHDAANPGQGDLNSTLVNTPLKQTAGVPPSQNETLMVPPPGLRTATGLQRPGAPGGVPQATPSKPAGMPTHSSLAGPPPVGGSTLASTIAKRPGAAGTPPNKPSFVPLDEESLKIRTNPEEQKAPARRYSTAKYKALFGESMPVIKPPPLPAPEPEAAPPEEGAGGDDLESAVTEAEDNMGGFEMEAKAEMTPEEAEYQRKKKSKHYKDNVCRDCVQYRKDRPDKEKMAQGRGWCTLLRKEVKASHTCPRGKW
jgi:hypothetical protein